MLIGLTGGIASGKSTVSALFVKHGALLVDADQVAREVVEPGEPALLQIIEQFGEQVLNADGSLNRQALGALVFSDVDKLKQLEQITHPAIRARMQEKFKLYKHQQPDALIIADIPLLYETKQTHLYEGIVVVYIPRSMQIERLMKRNHLSEKEAADRIALQMDIEEKKKLADWIIDNSSTLEHTEQQVIELVKRLRTR
ncbi:dephospho-CoA kinase [Paenibacillus montaniterrae]|uniref:Dephospho-CoA kinase n=1 Tax=Paenibacillus montaniterrae TaxID=429341 RepID=A0A919YNP7_9BACL|nr:dephospho-CoA kinase [Paenibacillus montaniterrae]GIP15466.1 dephospho-CoA kinase [Paenibacillus montaniterrae]